MNKNSCQSPVRLTSSGNTLIFRKPDFLKKLGRGPTPLVGGRGRAPLEPL